jgi:hypothetical protein
MADSASELSQQIKSTLKVIDPDISAEPVTVEGKIIDAVADVASRGNTSQFVLNYQFDIDTKFGADLDKFIALFGWGRQSGIKASGTVTFGRSTPAANDVTILAGTQVIKAATTVSPQVTFYTTATVVLTQGTTSVDAPIEASVIGPTGNVPANTITGLTTASTEVSSATNVNATSGGKDQETDAELRIRFKNQVLRNVSGTRDMYLALAVASSFADKATVIGPLSRFIEYLQIPSSGTTIASQNPYSKYTYSFDYYLTDGNIGNETFFTPTTHYTMSTAAPPVVTIVDALTLTPNMIVLLEHAYCSANSRNDPANNVANYIDVYVSGQDVTSASESANFPSGANTFNNTSSSPYYIQNFKRLSGARPLIGSRFQPLVWQPALSIPTSITIGSSKYFEGSDYWFVSDVTNYRGSRRGRNGIEWSPGAVVSIGLLANQEFVIAYTFDKLPVALNQLMEAQKQVISDVLVHSANQRFFAINLVVMLQPGFSKAAVDQNLATALGNFLSSQQFGALIQISDLLEVAHEVQGVDNVRLAQPSDTGSYGVQEIALDGFTPLGAPYTNDFALQDSDLPILERVNTLLRAENTWQGF